MTDKERLEEIENKKFFDVVNGELLKLENVNRLIEQAERAQELESELNKQIEIGYKFEGEVYDLAKENKRYREALNTIITLWIASTDEVYDAIQDAIKALEGAE